MSKEKNEHELRKSKEKLSFGPFEVTLGMSHLITQESQMSPKSSSPEMLQIIHRAPFNTPSQEGNKLFFPTDQKTTDKLEEIKEELALSISEEGLPKLESLACFTFIFSFSLRVFEQQLPEQPSFSFFSSVRESNCSVTMD